MTHLVRPAPVQLIIILALFLAGALALLPAEPAQAQPLDPRPTVTIQSGLRSGETGVPQGAAAVFNLRRSGHTSDDLTVRVETREPRRAVGFGDNPTIRRHTVRFEPGESQVALYVATIGATGNQGVISANLEGSSAYIQGNPSSVNITIRDVGDDDVILTIAASESSIDEAEDAGFTLTRAGDTSSALTANVRVEDPDEAMRGNHWDDALQPGDFLRSVTFAANESTAAVSFPTRPNVRDTGDLTLTAFVQEDGDLSYWVGNSFSAKVTVADDDTALEVSLSVDPEEILEGDNVTFTVTRHGDTSAALEDAPFVLRIGPDFRRRIWPIYETPQDYGVAMGAGQSTMDLTFKVHLDSHDSEDSDFRYEAEIKLDLEVEVPEEHFEDYLKVRGDRKAGAAVRNQPRQRITFVSVGSGFEGRSESDRWRLRERFFEGQRVPFVIERSGTAAQIAKELEVTIHYFELYYPYREGTVARPESYYNPSEQLAFITFPAGETQANGEFVVAVDDVDDVVESVRDRHHFYIYVESTTFGGYSSPYKGYSVTTPGRLLGVVYAYIRDNPRAVSIKVVDDDPDINDESTDEDEHTIDEGETAEFTLTRLGATDSALTVNVAIDDPGNFRRGNHGQDTPDSTVPVTFAAGSDTATLSVPTVDDWRDIPDNTLTAAILPSQNNSYRPAYADEGATSASVTVTDNDTAPQVELSVSPSTMEEGKTAVFSISRDNSGISLDFTVLYGLEGEEEVQVYGLGPGESQLDVHLTPEDDDYDDPDERVYKMTLQPLENVPEDEQAEYYTVNGPTSVSVTVTDNDLPLVGVEAVQESYREAARGRFRFVREGHTGDALSVKGILSQTGNSLLNSLQELLLSGEQTYTIPAFEESHIQGYTIQWQDGDEDDTSLTLDLVSDPTKYRMDPERSSATFTVVDIDPTPTVSVSAATAAEGAGQIEFEVSVSSISVVRPPSRRTITVDYATRSDTARAGNDYTTQTGTLTIEPHGTSATIIVPLVDNGLVELVESFNLVLSNPVNAVLQDGQEEQAAVGTITDDEPFVTLSAVNDEIEEGEDAVFEFTRTGDATEAMTVYFKAGYDDGREKWESVEIPAGQSNVQWSFTTEENELDSADRRYGAYLIPPTWWLQPWYYDSEYTLVWIAIKDDDLPVITLAPVSERVQEGHDADFTLTRVGRTDVTLTVDVSVTRAGSLFPSATPPSSVTFAVGSSTATLTVPTQGDTTLEDHGSIAVAISEDESEDAQYSLGTPASATVEVADNDRSGVTLSIASANAVVDEGQNAVFTVTRTGGGELTGLTARVRVADVRNSRTWYLVSQKWADFVNPVSRLYSENEHDVSFEAGSDTANLTISTEDETYNDGNSYLKATLQLSGSYAANPTSSIAVVWVRDDDIPTVTITPETLEHVEDGTTRPYTLHRTGDTSTTLTVTVGSWKLWHWGSLEGDERVPSEGLYQYPRRINTRNASQLQVLGLFRNAPIDGAEGSIEIQPFYCETVPGDCATRPQYRLGSPSSHSATIHNNAMGVRIEADQASVDEGGTATFTLTRHGGTPANLVYIVTARVMVTQNGEFIDGTAPETVTFTGYPSVRVAEAPLTVTLSIPTVDDSAYEGDGAIEVVLLPSNDLNAVERPFEITGSGRASVTVIDDDLPAVSISDATASESAGNIEFTVTMPASDDKATVEWATSNGAGANAATAGSDYEAASGEIVFKAGETTRTISVTLTDDSVSEGDETFVVTLSNPTGAVLGDDAGATGTIQDDDLRAEVTVTASDTDVEEGEVASFTFSRGVEGGVSTPEGFGSEPLTISVTLTQQGEFFKDAEANYGGAEVDYDEETGTATLAIPGGQLAFTLNLTTDDDSIAELDGSITIALAEGTGYVVGNPGSATVNVSDNDVGISIADALQDESKTNMTFTVSLSRAAEETVTVVASTMDGTLTANSAVGAATSNSAVTATSLGRDFEQKSETLTFAAGETEKQFTVTVLDDTLDEESEESFTVGLSQPSENASMLDGEATGTIEDNDAALIARLYREERTVTEDAEGPVTFRFHLEPQEGSGTTATELPAAVSWTVEPGTAAAGEDYAEVSGTQTARIQPGATSKTVEVDLIDDNRFEALNETFTFKMSGAIHVAYDSDNPSIEVTIQDDDGMQASVIAVSSSVAEGDDATFNVTLANSVSTAPVEIAYTVFGTAGQADYTAPPGTLTIPAGESSGVVTIPTLTDNVLDPGETVGVQLTRATSNGRDISVPSLGSASHATILDDSVLSASISAASQANEGDGVEFTVQLSIATDVPVRVDWETSDDEDQQAAATEGEDYTGMSGTVTIPAGDTSTTFTVATLVDNLFEGNETFMATLTGATRGADPNTATAIDLGISSAVGTITDDDAEPTAITLTAAPSTVSEGAGETTFTVTGTLTGPSRLPDDVHVTLGVTGSVSAAGGGEEATPVTLSIPAGQANGTTTLTFTPLDDEVDGGDARVRITGTALGFTVTEAIVSVTDDDDPPTGVALAIAPNSIGEGEGATTLTVTGTLTGGDLRPVDTRVTLSVQGASFPGENPGDDPSTAAVSDDFTAAAGVSLTIPAGQRTGTAAVTFTPTDDIVAEGDETAQVSGTSEGLEVTPAPLTIRDNEEEPDGIRLSTSPSSVAEDRGTVDIQVTARLEGGGARTASTTLELSVEDVSATVGADYTVGSSATLTIPAGQMSGAATLSITLVNDSFHEPTERVAIRGTNEDPGLPVTGAHVSISDDDEEPTKIVLSLDRSVVSEDGGPQQLRVTAEIKGSSRRTTGTLVYLRFVNGTAAVSDYLARAGTLTIRSGKIDGATVVNISPTDDSIDEGEETVELRGSASFRDLTVQSAFVTITDNDTKGVIITPASLTVDEGDSTGVTYTVKLATEPSEEVTVTVTGQDGTDLSLTGLSSTNTLTFTTTNWNTAQTITVTAAQDSDGVDDSVTLTHTAAGGEYAGVSADLSITVTDDDRGIVLGKTSLEVEEGDATGVSYTVKLATEPSEEVTVTVTGHTGTDLTLTGLSATGILTFTTTNWNTAQTITVKAGQDSDGTDDSVTLTHTAAGGEYADVSADLPITVTDDDRGLVLSETSLEVEEGDTAGVTYTVKLATEPSEEVTVTVTGHSGTDVALDKTTLTFTTDNWNTSQTITVKAGQDSDGADDSVTLTHSAAGGEYAGVSADLTITVTDDDRGIVLGKTSLEVDEGDATGVSYTVKLATEPSEEVTVTVTGHTGTDLTLTGLSAAGILTFTTTNWNTAQTITVKAGQDSDGVDDSVTLTHSAAGGEYAGVSADLTITVTDDDRGIVLGKTSLEVDEGDATGVSYTVKLATEPSEEVTVTVTGHTGTDLTLTGLSATGILTFTTTNWNTAQTITVKAGQDPDGVDDSVTLTHSAAGGEYAGLSADLPVTVTDDETAGLVLSESSHTVDEGDATGVSYTVKLATEPSEEVTVTVTGHANTDVPLTLTGLSATGTLTFTTTNWNTAQTVTVKAGQDSDGADDSVTLTHTAAGGEYAGVSADLTVNINDDDRASSSAGPPSPLTRATRRE